MKKPTTRVYWLQLAGSAPTVEKPGTRSLKSVADTKTPGAKDEKPATGSTAQK